ncbi:S8 family serine peptidase [Actinoplanes sp. NPDC049599]|uniref:S8 family serine peptidase n=1 Tax=Actinoplanes sp. NPDC049599 TaxID=3363903 RepID=UPI0037A87A20
MAVLAAVAVVFGSVVPARADSVRDKQWFWAPLRVEQAQRLSKGAGVVVAVLDTGVDAGHQDLDGAVLPGRQVVRDKPAGDLDTVGHGTGMAGVIAGRGHGAGRGVLGIAPQAKIMPITPANDTFFVAKGIRWAADHGAKVINLAFGVADGEGLRAAVSAAAAADVVLVSTAGNTGDKGNEMEYPGAYPEVLTVGAVDRKNKVAGFSNHGPHVDLVAPGVDIPAPAPDNKYVTGTGTSGAAAIVAGAAALIRAKYPELSATEVVQRLTSTAVDRGDPGRDDYYGAGQLDLLAALEAAPADPAASAPAPDGPAAVPDAAPADEDGGIPPLLFVGAGIMLLLVIGAAILIARPRRAGG